MAPLRSFFVTGCTFILGFSICLVLHNTNLIFNSSSSQQQQEISINSILFQTEQQQTAKRSNATLALSSSVEQGRQINDDSDKNKDILDEIHEISGGLDVDNVECPPPLVLFHNRLVRPNSTITTHDNNTSSLSTPRLIPRMLHFSMKSRCLPRDLARTLDRWMVQFPNYSIFFHDDEAVDRLIHQEWPEFPDLHRVMKCVFYSGAMVIDIWRVLILWKYGGVYSDIDNWPEDTFTDDVIPANISAFFFPDYFNRPSQWFMGLEPRHPMMYDAMSFIIHNIYNIPNIRKPSVVQVTGPKAVKDAYAIFLPHLWKISADAVFVNDKVLDGNFGKTVLKVWNGDYTKGEHIYITLKKDYHEIVPFNATLNVTRKERIEMESGVFHWQKVIFKVSKTQTVPRISCSNYLKLLNSQK